MKRYKINEAGGCATAKSGIKWRYAGKVENPQEAIDKFESEIEFRRTLHSKGYATRIGLRITDTVTGQVIYERMIF